MIKERIPRLQTDQAAAAYWDTHSFAEAAKDTTEATIRFVRCSRKRSASSLILSAKLEAIAEADFC